MQCVHGKKKTTDNNNNNNSNKKKYINRKTNIPFNFRREVVQGICMCIVCVYIDILTAGLKTNRMHTKRGGGEDE